MINRLLPPVFALLLWTSAALCQPGPGPGPGPVPSPWTVNGNTISYPGAVLGPANVTGGSKGAGTYNVSGGYYVNGVLVSGLPPTVSHGLVCNLTGGSAVPTSCTWNSFASVAIGTVSNSFPFYTGGSWTTLTTGKSVLNPGTGALEAILPVQTSTGTSKSFVTADLFIETRRSNSGSSMSDTFPVAATTGLINGTRITYNNTDASATATITAGAGTTMSSGGPTDTVGPGRSIEYVYDAPLTQWRRTYNTGTALLGPNNLTDLSNTTTARNNLIPSGTITNAQLVNTTILVNTISCTLGSSCTISASAGAITVGVTNVGGGPGILYNTTSGGLLSAVTVVNNALLSADGSGVLSMSTTLPAGLTVPTPTITGPTITGGSYTSATALSIRSTGTGAFNLGFANTENLTANRNLTLTLGDAARTMSISGAVTFGANFTTGGNNLTLTTTGASNVTVPLTGTLSTLAGVEALTNKTVNGNTLTAGTWTLTGGAGKTLTFNNTLTLTGTDGTTMTFPTTSATLARTDAGQTFTGVQAFSGAVTHTSTVTVTSASASALSVGLNGATNPVLNLDASTASSATGINIKSAAAAGGVAISVLSSGTNENLTLDAKGSGTVTVNVTGTGGITLSRAVTLGSTINKYTLTAPATGATLTIADNKTHVVSNSITLAGTDSTTWTGASANMTLAALNLTGQTITGGAIVTPPAALTTSFTADCGRGPLQPITGPTSAWSITAPAADGSCMFKLTNAGSSAVAPSFSGFSAGPNTGAIITTVGSSVFTISIWRIGGTSGYSVYAHQ